MFKYFYQIKKKVLLLHLHSIVKYAYVDYLEDIKDADLL